VRGVSDDFWATFIDPNPDIPDKRVVTVWGQGPVNVNTANPQALLTIACQASNNTARVCTDANEAQKFILAMSMLRSFMPGLPVFKNGDEFVNALKQTNTATGAPGAPAAPGASAIPGLGGGGSPIGMIMKALQLEPIPVLSPEQTKKAVSTESKVFSIYATGYVRSGKRESSVRIHAVVDFRGAPAPQQLIANLLSGQGFGGGPGQTPTPSPATSGSASGSPPPPGIPAALKPGPGGNVVYYRVD
jgi:general secretion pathway protein K